MYKSYSCLNHDEVVQWLNENHTKFSEIISITSTYDSFRSKSYFIIFYKERC